MLLSLSIEICHLETSLDDASKKFWNVHCSSIDRKCSENAWIKV